MKNEKKIVIILTSMDPYKDIRAIKHANVLINMGYNVKLIGGYSEEKYRFKTQYLVYHYNKQYKENTNLLKKMLWKISYIQFAKKIIKLSNPLIIHACNVDMLYIAYQFRRKARIIYDSYEINASKTGIVSDYKLIGKIIEFMEKRIITKVDYMICVSQSAKVYFNKKYKISNIYHHMSKAINPYGDGNAAQKILQILISYFGLNNDVK